MPKLKSSGYIRSVDMKPGHLAKRMKEIYWPKVLAEKIERDANAAEVAAKVKPLIKVKP